MLQYVTIRGIYENGNIHLLENINKTIKEKSEVIIFIPIGKKKGFDITDFIHKGNYCSIGGDSFNDSEELYNA